MTICRHVPTCMDMCICKCNKHITCPYACLCACVCVRMQHKKVLGYQPGQIRFNLRWAMPSWCCCFETVYPLAPSCSNADLVIGVNWSRNASLLYNIINYSFKKISFISIDTSNCNYFNLLHISSKTLTKFISVGLRYVTNTLAKHSTLIRIC